MSYWNYRIVRREREHEGHPFVRFGIHEAYYDDAGRVRAISEDPMEPHGETLEELRQDLRWMIQALRKPVLDYDQVPEPGAVPFGEEEEEP